MYRSYLKHLKHAVVLSAVAFLAHGAWELVACPLFYEHGSYPATRWGMLRATLGDVGLTWIIYGTVAAFSRRWRWAGGRWDYLQVGVLAVIALVVALVIEIRALRSGAWSYRESMPTIAGLGIVPFVQLLLLTPLIVIVSERVVEGAIKVRRYGRNSGKTVSDNAASGTSNS